MPAFIKKLLFGKRSADSQADLILALAALLFIALLIAADALDDAAASLRETGVSRRRTQ